MKSWILKNVNLMVDAGIANASTELDKNLTYLDHHHTQCDAYFPV